MIKAKYIIKEVWDGQFGRTYIVKLEWLGIVWFWNHAVGTKEHCEDWIDFHNKPKSSCYQPIDRMDNSNPPDDSGTN